MSNHQNNIPLGYLPIYQVTMLIILTAQNVSPSLKLLYHLSTISFKRSPKRQVLMSNPANASAKLFVPCSTAELALQR